MVALSTQYSCVDVDTADLDAVLLCMNNGVAAVAVLASCCISPPAYVVRA
jgi:hypothetical protein